MQSSLHNLRANTDLAIRHQSVWLTNIHLASEAHLLPDVVVGKEASQLSLCQWSTMIRVTVPREHVDAQSMNFTDIHRSDIDIEEQIGNDKGRHVALPRTKEVLIKQSELTFHRQLQ